MTNARKCLLLRSATVSAALLGALLAVGSLTPAANAAVTFPGSNPQRVYGPGAAQEYAYAPSALTDGGHSYYYTCHNDTSGQIKDHIYFSQVDTPNATPQRDFSVMQGSPGAWDANHTCDPSIVAAQVNYLGTAYSLAMFYLGTSAGNSNNSIGVAFSNSFDGPWVKYPNPIVNSPFGDANLWGAGMPSATTVDFAAGRIMLWYSVDGNNSANGTRNTYDDSKNHAYFRDITLGNMATPIIGAPVEITKAGLTGGGGAPDVLHNFDVAYDPTRDRFYMVREQHPFPTNEPWYISTTVVVSSIAGSSIWNGTGTWTTEGSIGPTQTGFARNHNPGILRSRYGTLPNSGAVTVVFTKSAEGLFPDTLWGYDLWQMTGSIT